MCWGSCIAYHHNDYHFGTRIAISGRKFFRKINFVLELRTPKERKKEDGKKKSGKIHRP